MKKVLLALLPALLLGTAYAQEKSETEEETKETHSCCQKMGTKIWYVSPIKFTENGVGFELGYEHGMDANGIVAYNLPIVATFNMSNHNYAGTTTQDPMVYFMPGIKFYPTSSFGKVKYALGPSLVVGFGQKTDYGNVYYDPYYTYPYPTYTGPVTQNKFVLGVMINNSLNINPSAHLTLGLDFGFGFSYISRVGDYNENMQGLVQGGFKMGYRL